MNIEKGRIVNDFIDPNRRQYVIPVYQRNYEWTKDQCEKLFFDILVAAKNDKTHFCGSIVYAPLKEENKIQYYIIIDGQQRLTTIYLLLKAMLDEAEDDKTRDVLLDTLLNKDKFDKFGIDKASKLKLKPIKSDEEQLSILMDDNANKEKIDKNSGIWKNYALFRELIKKELIDGAYVKDIYKGVENLFCAKILLDKEDNAQEMFERINSTGIPLSLADKIRNFVLMTEVDQEHLYTKYWLEIERLLSKEDMKAFLLDYLNLKREGFSKEVEAYEDFKNIYKNQYGNCKNGKEEVLKELLHYAKQYHIFLYADSKYGDEVNALLTNMQELKQTTVFLFLFRVFDDFENKVIDEPTLEKILRFLRSYSIRRLICEVGSNSLRGLYKSLYDRVFNNIANKEHYYDSIICFFKQLTSKDAIVNDSSFVEALKYKNLYRKNALCKYLLGAIENQGKEQVKVDSLTIEHIMPQNKNLSTYWQKMLGENWQAVQEKYIHTLGNLTLTGYNSELGDKPFLEKKALIESKDSKVVTLYSDVKDKNEWVVDNIEARAERLAKIILKLCSIEEPETVVSFYDPRYKEYSCDEPDKATNKWPNYYILQGERVNVTNFSQMLRSVVDRLYILDDRIIKQMAYNEENPINSSKSILFTYYKDKINSEYKVADTGIYLRTGFSSSHIITIIKALLVKYDIDTDDFIYSAREFKNNTVAN